MAERFDRRETPPKKRPLPTVRDLGFSRRSPLLTYTDGGRRPVSIIDGKSSYGDHARVGGTTQHFLQPKIVHNLQASSSGRAQKLYSDGR